jgi:hypothetical protein
MEQQTPKGAWDQWTADKYHQSSPALAEFLINYLKHSNYVYDFGCGNAFYISELAKEGFSCQGIEGFKLNNFLHPNVTVADLSKPMRCLRTGSVISLEVGEHIPKEGEQVFLNNITSHCDSDLIISWALPDQPGIGHVNCQPQEYIIDQIEKRGFIFLPVNTLEARNNVDDNCDWFRRTLLIFKRK